LLGKAVLAIIREDLESKVGKRVRLRANRGRKKVLEKIGILEKTYPHIFVIRIEENRVPGRRVSFSYADVLTNTVELIVEDEDGSRKIGIKEG